ARRVRDRIRGVSPWPGAVTYMQGGALKIWSANILNEESREEPGTVILADAKRGLAVACGVGALELTEIQPPGGKRMDARAYLRGRQIPLGIKLGGG
ncbi:MAG: methionyl-tRNA formyltransferase, partial [Oscillospiraceae bacterium]|nr:methionyl-tRNA formyltransferase [Oscillospiraceae bacterium]